MTWVDELIRTFSPAPQADAVENADLAAARAALDGEMAGEARTRLPRGGRAWRITKPLRFIPLAVAGSVVVAIVALALTVGRDHATRVPSLTGPAAGPAANDLISRLAVLQRPQTAADQLPRHLVVNPTPKGVTAPGRGQQGVIIPSLTRLVATRPYAKLYLVVTTPARGSQALWKPSEGDQVAIVAITSRGATESDGYPAAALSDSRELIRAGLLIASGGPAKARAAALRAYDVSVVPDGVVRVRWTFADRAGSPGRVIRTPVANNVAITPLAASTEVLLRATWYSPTGSVVPTSAEAIDQATAAQQATERRQALTQAERQHVRAPAQLLDAFAVFSFESPAGTRTPDGYVIAHPPMSQLPLALLNGFGRGALDLRQARSVRAPNGLKMWIAPGPDGICLFQTDAPTKLPYGLVGGVSGGSACSGNLQLAIANGAGVDADNQHGAVQYGVVPKTIHSVKIRISRSTTRAIHPKDGVYILQTPFHFG